MQQRITSQRQRDYLIRLHLPPGEPPPAGHPLVWLLDAPTTWAPMQQALNAADGPGVAVAGIDWDVDGAVEPGLRRRDFTLPALHPVPPPRGSAHDWGADGDCAAFLDFLTGDLQPKLLGELPVDPARQTLAGHSLSGLFVLEALLDRPGRFARYVAASPSIWWDGARIVEDARDAHWDGARPRVLLTVGSEEQAVGPEKPPEVAGGDEPAMLGDPHMVDNASAFAGLLRRRGVDCEFRLFEGEGHGSVLAPAMAAALAFAAAD